MKALSADTYLARLLGKLAAVVIRRPNWFIYSQVVLFFVCVGYTVAFLQFDTNRNHLVGANKKYEQIYLRFHQEFQQQDDLVVVVEGDNPEKNRQFVERLGAKLEAETNLFTDVFYKGDLTMMGPKALQFAPESDLAELKQMLQAKLPFIQQFIETTNLVSFFEKINAQFNAPRGTNSQARSLVQALPALTSIVNQAADSLQRSGTPLSPDLATLFNAGTEANTNSYITFKGGQIFLVTAHAPRENLNNKAVERIRHLVKQTQDEVPGLNIGLTGEPVLEYDEMRQSQKDTTLASIVSLVLCALIFIYGYNETGRPVKATLCLIVGLAYTLAFATLTVGHLNVLTITFVPILIGLAIDFGVHLVTRYEEELRRGKTAEAALTKAMVFTGQGIFTGALTTAGAFLAMVLTNFKGIQEMGLICGGGLLVCFVPMMTLLPALLLRGHQNTIDHEKSQVDTRARIENIWLQRPVIVVAVTVALCAIAATQLRKVYFDYNLLNMQSAGLPSVEFEQKLINSAGKSVLFGAVMADSLTNAIKLEEKIKKLPTVGDVESIAGFLNQDQNEKLKLIKQIKQEVGNLKFSAPDTNPVNVPDLSRTLYSLYGYLGAAVNEVGDSDSALTRQFNTLRQAIENLRKLMLQGDDNDAMTERADKLAQFQQTLFADMRETFQTLQDQDDTAPLRVEDLPAALRDRFIGVTGKFLLQVYPKYDVWQRGNQEKFIADLRSVYPDVTGTPVQLYEYTSLLKDSYVQASWYSLIAIAILVFIHFRSLVSVILALFPVFIGTLWLVGLMGWFDIPFNPANIMTLPLVIGIGVTNGIHILNRFAEEQTPSILSRSTGKAVLVSGLTAIVGFGSLILAKHRGIHSLGCVMSIGITTCMIAGLTFLPALLNLMGRYRVTSMTITKRPSVNTKSSTPGQEEPR
ncbi:MAG TPA: MMPL family transporter [Verrucomicrobiae bacterium]|nr:MMPL family transporter [Verrucomicrobiae bacterium]